MKKTLLNPIDVKGYTYDEESKTLNIEVSEILENHLEKLEVAMQGKVVRIINFNTKVKFPEDSNEIMGRLIGIKDLDSIKSNQIGYYVNGLDNIDFSEVKFMQGFLKKCLNEKIILLNLWMPKIKNLNWFLCDLQAKSIEIGGLYAPNVESLIWFIGCNPLLEEIKLYDLNFHSSKEALFPFANNPSLKDFVFPKGLNHLKKMYGLMAHSHIKSFSFESKCFPCLEDLPEAFENARIEDLYFEDLDFPNLLYVFMFADGAIINTFHFKNINAPKLHRRKDVFLPRYLKSNVIT